MPSKLSVIPSIICHTRLRACIRFGKLQHRTFLIYYTWLWGLCLNTCMVLYYVGYIDCSHALSHYSHARSVSPSISPNQRVLIPLCKLILMRFHMVLFLVLLNVFCEYVFMGVCLFLLWKMCVCVCAPSIRIALSCLSNMSSNVPSKLIEIHWLYVCFAVGSKDFCDMPINLYLPFICFSWLRWVGDR